MSTVHVFDYLESADPAAAVTVVFGDEPFLKRLALGQVQVNTLGADQPYATYSGPQVQWRDVIDELTTVSLFGGDRPRLVVVDDADDFVSAHRERLEDHVQRSSARGVLVLIVSSWASNTRLYKAVDKLGVQIQCRAPEVKGRGKRVDQPRVVRWLQQRGSQEHGVQLDTDTTETLVDLVGLQFGRLDQELAKLALYADAKQRVTADVVREVVGGWTAKTTWEMVDAAASGDAAAAFEQLTRLLQAGEHPAALFGQIAWSLRRFAIATQVVEQAERDGTRIVLEEALEQAGFRRWPSGAIQQATRQLRQITRHRARQLNRWLLDADLALKGTHSTPARARLVLERLILKISRATSAIAAG